jgi:hypothetical protein
MYPCGKTPLSLTARTTCPSTGLYGEKRDLFAVRQDLEERRLVPIHAVTVVDGGHVGRAEAVALQRAVTLAQQLSSKRRVTPPLGKGKKPRAGGVCQRATELDRSERCVEPIAKAAGRLADRPRRLKCEPVCSGG